MTDINLSSFIWSVADLLRGDYKQSEYGRVILPFTVLRRLDCVLAPTKKAVLAELALRKKAGVNPEPFLLKTAGLKFVNTSALDLRTLRPLDTPTLLASVEKTHRALVVDEGWRTGGLSAEISARIQEGAFYSLDAPVGRLCTAEVPIPYPRHLEQAALPQEADIIAMARNLVQEAA